MKDIVNRLNNQPCTTLQEVFDNLIHCGLEKLAFSTSFSLEDQVIFEFIVHSFPKVRCFTLDTGRLFQETYDVYGKTLAQYKFPIEPFHPEESDLKDLYAQGGPNLFYQSVEKRRLCCHVRKVKPLQRALLGAQVWITGLRKEQSVTREDLPVYEWDETYQLIKCHPLLHWSLDEVWKVIHDKKIPYNELHLKGYPSIGCAPCTRAVDEGEDPRAGRWWWEQPEQKECGLHK